MLLLHGCSQLDIGRAQRQFEFLPLDSKTCFELLEPAVLRGIEVEFIMDEIMEGLRVAGLAPFVCRKCTDAPSCHRQQNSQQQLKTTYFHGST